jgi:NAD(P)H-hydrate epimerase
VPISLEPPSTPEAIIDGLIGYGLRGNPQDQTAALIEWANVSGLPVCSLDLPSGLDANTGMPGTPCMRASITLTLALPKTGLLSPTARGVTGTLLLADISIPARIYESLGLARPDAFSASPVVQIAG